MSGCFGASLVFVVLIAGAFAGCPEIVPRAGWGARPARSRPQMGPGAVGHVFIHHTAGAACADKTSCAKVARQTQGYHMDTNKWSDIGYSFLIGGDGRAYEGRGWKGVGAHTVNFNSKSLGISLMGNFDRTLPSATMLKATRDLIDCGVQKGYIAKSRQIHGHRDAKCIACPGEALPRSFCPQGYIAKSRQIHGHRDAKCTACPGEALYKHIQSWPGFKAGKLPGYTC